MCDRQQSLHNVNLKLSSIWYDFSSSVVGTKIIFEQKNIQFCFFLFFFWFRFAFRLRLVFHSEINSWKYIGFMPRLLCRYKIQDTGHSTFHGPQGIIGGAYTNARSAIMTKKEQLIKHENVFYFDSKPMSKHVDLIKFHSFHWDSSLLFFSCVPFLCFDFIEPYHLFDS